LSKPDTKATLSKPVEFRREIGEAILVSAADLSRESAAIFWKFAKENRFGRDEIKNDA
jgi:hypothetical protein